MYGVITDKRIFETVMKGGTEHLEFYTQMRIIENYKASLLSLEWQIDAALWKQAYV